MIKIGVIGTRNIVQRFIKQAATNKKVTITCIYWRSLDKAAIWAKKYKIAIKSKDYLSHDYWLNDSLMNVEVIKAIIKSENELGVDVYAK